MINYGILQSFLSLQEYIKYFISETSKYNNSKKHTCEPIFSRANTFPLSRSEKYYMVSTCLIGADETDIQSCKNQTSYSYEYIMPVFGDDNILYKNSFLCQMQLHRKVQHGEYKCWM